MRRREGLVVRLKLKDEHGNVVGEVDAVAFKGLLSLAHDEGLRSVRTKLLQIPTEENGKSAIVEARVRTSKGSFTGIGDASPANVNRRIAPHVVRMAETRAVARALRLAVNIGEVAIEELADDHATVGPAPVASLRPPASNGAPPRNGGHALERFRGRDRDPEGPATGDERAMSSEQKKLLYRLVLEKGATRETATDKVLEALGVERLEHATRTDASRAIDGLKGRQRNGGANGTAETNGSPPP